MNKIICKCWWCTGVISPFTIEEKHSQIIAEHMLKEKDITHSLYPLGGPFFLQNNVLDDIHKGILIPLIPRRTQPEIIGDFFKAKIIEEIANRGDVQTLVDIAEKRYGKNIL